MTVEYEIRILPNDEENMIDPEHYELGQVIEALAFYESLKEDGHDPELLVLKWPNDYADCIEYGACGSVTAPYSKLPKYVKTAMMKARPDIFKYLLADY